MDTEHLLRKKPWLVSAGIVAVIVVWLLSGSDEDPESARSSNGFGSTAAAFSVRVRDQVAEDVVRTIVLNGSTAPARRVELKAETDGRVVQTGVERGASVREGAVIVRFDDRDRDARLAQARAVVQQRELEYDGRQRLNNDSYVSEAQLQAALAQLETARADLRRAELDKTNTYVRAPFDGALLERHVEIGDFVSAGDPVASYVDNRSLVVSAAVSEFDASYVDVGEAASAVLATGETVRGVIRYVAPVADADTRTFVVELEIDNADGLLRAGTTAKLEIPGARIEAHRIAPSLLTLDDEGRVGIKIINDDDIVEFHEADVAHSTADGVFVSGLPRTIRLITVGQGFVSAGSSATAVLEDDVDRAVAAKAKERNEQ